MFRFPLPAVCALGALCLLLASCSTAAPSPAPVSPAAAPQEVSRAADPQSEPEPLLNTLRWRTSSEVDNFGFDVYRGETKDGPFERLNDDPIPGQGTSDVPAQYEFVDATIEPDTVYYYYVESISTYGDREQFTPIFASKPKSPAVGDEGPAGSR